MGEAGTANLAPYSFFNTFNYRPPIIGFASIGWKDSITNISRSREFVWNMATLPLAEAMNITSAKVPPEVDEFTLAGIAKAPARLVNVPMVAASPATFECRLTQIVPLVDVQGDECGTWLVLGQVVGVHIDPEMLKDEQFITDKANPILRAGDGGDYYSLNAGNRFVMQRPQS